MSSRIGSRLVVASGNRHKVAELRAMLQEADKGLEVVGLGDLPGPAPTIEESEPTFAGNARLKAEGIARWLAEHGEPGDTVVLADDSGVSVDALGGAPGVRSARFAGEHASDADNNHALVAALHELGIDRSPAHYTCVLALVRVDGEPLGDTPDGVARFDGRWDVSVRAQARGSGGFGYDPHAWLAARAGEVERTVAELAPDEKARLSHRGQALRALLGWLQGS